MNNPQGKRLIPEELLNYLKSLKKNHSDPSAEWGSSGGGATLDDIVDSAGNKRFVEGNGTPDTTNITSSYCKWSLSGTHLMVVLAGKYISGSVADKTVLAQYEVPSFILNKIYPVWSNNIEMKTVTSRTVGGTGFEDYFLFTKEDGKLKIKQQGVYNHNDTYFRAQFDLLIDADYS